MEDPVDSALVAANKLAAQARKAARDSEVQFDVAEKLTRVVCDGQLSTELAAAFSFTQEKLEGSLV